MPSPIVSLSPIPKLAFLISGQPASGAKLFTYAAGTTTKQNSYTDSTGATPNTNPIILDSRGECNCWLDDSLIYKLTLAPSTDTDPPTNSVWTVDQISPTASALQVQSGAFTGITSVAGTNTITGSLSPALSAYAVNQIFTFTPANTNTGATTLNINSLGAKNLFIGGAACVGGEIRSGVPVVVQYDGTQFNIIGPYVGGNLPTGQVKYPATQNPSTDPNTQDDYEEGSWTTVVTFATPGDLSVTYLVQNGYYVKVGQLTSINWNLQTSAFTFTTASGSLRVTGVPFISVNLSGYAAPGALAFGGVTKASYTQVVAEIVNNTTTLLFEASGSGQSPVNLAATDVPTGGTVILRGQITYRAAA